MFRIFLVLNNVNNYHYRIFSNTILFSFNRFFDRFKKRNTNSTSNDKQLGIWGWLTTLPRASRRSLSYVRRMMATSWCSSASSLRRPSLRSAGIAAMNCSRRTTEHSSSKVSDLILHRILIKLIKMVISNLLIVTEIRIIN